MKFKSYTLSGNWTLVKEENRPHDAFPYAIPELPTYSIHVPHQYDQTKWKLDYAYSKAVSRYHGYVWYYRTFEAMPELPENERYRLDFDRVSYVCEVFLNGARIGEHRHSEEPFSFDVTESVRHTGENLLAVRCFEPLHGGQVIDGIRLDQIPNGFWAGEITDESCIPVNVLDPAGGILEEVRLSVVPTVRICDVFVRPDPKTGKVGLEISVMNDTEATQELSLNVYFSEFRKDSTVATAQTSVSVPSGTTSVTITATIPHHVLWELNNPALYLAQIQADNGAAHTVRFGFKDFRVQNGFFFLNGKRIFLKCAHGTMSSEAVIQMKAMGFNAFRSLQQVLPPEILSLCDELGLLIIESPLTAWGMRLHENTKRMLEEALCNMVHMHRNHVCVAAYYLFNELHDITILHMGKDCLPKLRDLAPDTLFLLASGRWDKEYNLGSISNPGSYEWECAWGQEGEADDLVHTYPTRFHASRNLGLGDLHPYVYIPMDSIAKQWFRTVGKNGKPIFISECGIGTQGHPHRTYFHRLYSGHAPQSASVRESKKVWDDLEAFLEHYGMEKVYAFATDICHASDRENGRQRQMMFDLIRSNPKINGFSLTSWGMSNEGAMEDTGVIKESVAYAMQEGWSPLRWALFTDARALYANQPFTVEAVLCNEDFLAPGSYRAQARIKDKDGIVWKRDFDAVYPKDGYANLPPLAATVLRESLSLPEGEYTFSVRLMEGGCPFGGELRFTVATPKYSVPTKSVTVWGLQENTLSFLRKNGIQTKEPIETDDCSAVFVGNPENSTDVSLWERLFSFAKKGAAVVFVNPELFDKEDTKPYLRRIAGESADCESTIDWLYHFDTVHVRHPLFDRIHDEGLLELDAFAELYPRVIFTNTAKADLTVAASVRIDSVNCATSLTIGEYRVGKGKMVLNGFRLEEALGKNPYADQMLFNFVEYYG